MKYSNVKLRDLETFEDHMDAIEAIKNDYLNVVGGLKAWLSGYETHLLEGAKKKIKAIEDRCWRLFPCEDDEE